MPENETRFLVQHELCKCKCRLNENECNSKQKWNHDDCRCECRELDHWISCKKGFKWNPSTYDCECDKARKISEYLDTKNCSCKKHLFGELVLACEDEMLNTIETTIVEKKVICEKNNCLIHTISLINICLFSLVCISISCHYYLRNKDVLSYQYKTNSVKEIDIKIVRITFSIT